MDDMHADAVRDRIAKLCDWFDEEPPTLKTRKGEVYFTEGLREWFKRTGASIDWILTGDAKAMATSYRKSWNQDREIAGLLRTLDDTELAIMTGELEDVQGGKDFNEALADMGRRIEEHRAKH